MKSKISKIMLPLFALLCLAGCGQAASTAQPAGERIEYDIYIPQEQKELNETYDVLRCKAALDRGLSWEESLPPRETAYDKAELAAFKKRVENTDIKDKLAAMYDMTDDILYQNTGDTRIYSISKDDSSILLHDEAGYFYNYGETFMHVREYDGFVNEICYSGGGSPERVSEYDGFVNEVCEGSGLFYNGTILGECYTRADEERAFYTGRNRIAFANRTFQLRQQAIHKEGRIFNDLPLRVVYYVDKNDIDFVHIYWLSGEAAPVMTENNLETLRSIKGIGSTAAELAEEFFGRTKSTEGKRSGIKYSYRPNIAEECDMQYSVLVLETE